MAVEIDTTTCRLSNFENGLVAEVARLQCREVELVEEIRRLQQQIERKDAEIAAGEKRLRDHTDTIERLTTRLAETQAASAAAPAPPDGE